MKKVFLLGVIALTVSGAALNAQQKFNVQNGTKTVFYDSLEIAIRQADSGDTIYLPGAVIPVKNDLIIDKKLAIIGAGCDVDSIGGLQTTEIKRPDGNYANINFRNGSDGSLLTGCIVNSITFGNMNQYNEPQQNIQNVTILRNKIYGVVKLGISSTANLVKQIILSENIIIMSITGMNASNCIINNNLIGPSGYMIDGLINSRISNNVIATVSNLQGCNIENNSFIDGTNDFGTNCTYNNNAFYHNLTFPIGSNTGSNNLMNQTVTQTFGIGSITYNSKNYIVRSDSPCKNAGTDGTDIGIFGGPNPYKAGAVPFNPHINKSNISAQTDKNGNLKVNIKVSAQIR